MCQSLVKEATKGPGMSLIAERYRRHVSRVKSPMAAMDSVTSQSIFLLCQRVGGVGWKDVGAVALRHI